jgi:hypothetical protein
MAAAALSGNDAVGEVGQCHWTGHTGWRASTSLYFETCEGSGGTGYLGSGRVGALPSSTSSTRRDRPVRGKGRSSHIGCFVLSFASPITRQRRSRKWQKKDAKKRLFHQLKLDAGQFPTPSPCAMSFFPSTGTRRAVGRFPRFFPGFWWI